MADHGSNLQINIPGSGITHNGLTDKNNNYQHKLESIYRDTDYKNLKEILEIISNSHSDFLYELVTVETTGQTEIVLTKFQYNPLVDVLLVTLQGFEVYDSISLDYIKTSPTTITFNYPLRAGEQVFIAIAGTQSNTHFEGDVREGITLFKQLLDTPNSYVGKAGQFLKIADNENGVELGYPIATIQRLSVTKFYTINQNESIEEWISFYNKCNIQTIRVTPVNSNNDPINYHGEFYFNLWTKPDGFWIYYSGVINTVLYDYMDVIHIDESGNDCIYLKLENKGPSVKFKVEIFSQI